MDSIIVLDTGGSKCEVLLLDLDGHIIGWGRDAMPGVGGRNSTAISNALREALGNQPRHFDTLYVTTLGLLLPMRSFGQFSVDHIELIPAHEWTAALAHAGLDHGIVLLAGTGAFAHATTADGRDRHLDGGGPILGDFGGGFHIGWLAVQATFRADWHPRHATTIRDRVLATFGIARPYDIIDLQLFSRDRSMVASISRIVDEEASRGDAVAIRIVRQAAEALAETFRDLVTSMQIEDCSGTVVGTGSLICQSSLYREHLWQRLGEIAPSWRTMHLTEPSVVSLGILTLKHLLGDTAAPGIHTLLGEARGRRPALPNTPSSQP